MTVSKFKFNVMDPFHEIITADKKIRGVCRSGVNYMTCTIINKITFLHKLMHMKQDLFYIYKKRTQNMIQCL